MTVLAWDGATLSADKMTTVSGTIFKCTKIERNEDCLLGFAGDSDLGFALLHWWKFDRYRTDHKDSFPQGKDKDNWARLLVVRADRKLELYERFAIPIIFEPQQFAIGSGMDYAMAIMSQGSSSREAVRVCNELDPHCGLGIDTLALEP